MNKTIKLLALLGVLVLSGCDNENIREECDRMVFGEVFISEYVPQCGNNPERYYCCFLNDYSGSVYYSDELKLKICEEFPEAIEQYEICDIEEPTCKKWDSDYVFDCKRWQDKLDGVEMDCEVDCGNHTTCLGYCYLYKYTKKEEYALNKIRCEHIFEETKYCVMR